MISEEQIISYIMSTEEDERFQFNFFVERTGYQFEDIIFRDKPDMQVTHCGHSLGIELTVGQPEESRRAEVIARKAGMEFYSVSSLQDNPKESRRSNCELKADIENIEFVQSERSAINWAFRISKRITKKIGLLKIGEIQRFELNWLVITDASPEFGTLDLDFYRAALMGSLGPEILENPEFDLIYILSSQHTIMIDQYSVIGISME